VRWDGDSRASFPNLVGRAYNDPVIEIIGAPAGGAVQARHSTLQHGGGGLFKSVPPQGLHRKTSEFGVMPKGVIEPGLVGGLGGDGNGGSHRETEDDNAD
jgi:hypothetical protein